MGWGGEGDRVTHLYLTQGAMERDALRKIHGQLYQKEIRGGALILIDIICIIYAKPFLCGTVKH